MTSTLSLRLPKELSEKVEKEAIKNNLPPGQYIVYLLTKIISYQEAQNELRNRLKRKSRSKALSILEKVPDVTPLKGDEIR